MLTSDPMHASYSSVSVDDLQSTRQHGTLHDTVRALRAKDASPSSASSSWSIDETHSSGTTDQPASSSSSSSSSASARTSKPDLQVWPSSSSSSLSSSTPRRTNHYKRPSPLQQSDSAAIVDATYNTNSSPTKSQFRSQGPNSPRERLEALLASESSPQPSPPPPPLFYHRDKPSNPPAHAASRNVSAPILPTSPPHSPEDMVPSRPDPRPVMARNPSLDSQVSSISSKISDIVTPADIAGLIATAGSAEAALLKLLKEKQSADSHNAQLWRVVEKQRSMILGLNKDLERAVKDKDRYRKKLKEVTQNFSAGTASIHRSDSAVDREASPPNAGVGKAEPAKPSAPLASSKPVEPVEAVSQSPREITAPEPKQHLLPDAISIPESHEDIASIEPSPVTSASRHGATSRERSRTPASASGSPFVMQSEFAQDMAKFPMPTQNVVAASPKSPPLSPPFTPPVNAPRMTITEATPMPDAGSFSPQGSTFSSPRGSKMQRKGAPAPLNLAQPTRPAPPPPPPVAAATITTTTEYEPLSSPAKTATEAELEEIERGRRRTRADDDRVRDAYVAAQEEARSLSKKSKSGKSSSKSKGPAEKPQIIEPESPPKSPGRPLLVGLPPSPRATKPPPNLASLLSPSNSDSSMSSTAAHRSNFSTPLLSPGLPMSPRPIDRPMGAPSPRLPKQMTLPPTGPQTAQRDTRFSVMSPSALPAPLFAKSAVSQASPESRLEVPRSDMDIEPSQVRARTPSSGGQPNNIYRGLVSEQYPKLLLPPNALPSIDVKVFSSRLRPSRHSLLLANPNDEDPVFLLGIYARSSGKQLWRLEKTIFALSELHQLVLSSCEFDGKLPEKALFSGHAPAKIDARRAALNAYFDLLLDTPLNEKAALIVCDFFSTNAMDAEQDLSPTVSTAPVAEGAPNISPERPVKEGYLTKRGKNFGGWRARYFVLDGPELKYYDSQNGPQVGVIKLVKAQIGKQSQQPSHEGGGKEDEPDNQYRHAFLILEPKKKDSSSLVRHVLCAESDEERDAWVAALMKYVDNKEKAGLEPETARDDAARAKAGQDSIMSTPRQKRKTQATPKKSNKEIEELGRDADSPDSELQESTLQAMSYENTVAGDMPIQGTTASKYSGRGLTSPTLNGSFAGMFGSNQAAKKEISISAPSKGAVIQNAESWGMKTPMKEKKRSIFGFHRARTPSDTTSGQSSTNSSVMANDRRAPLTRPIFGMPLAEAVELSQPAGIDVFLPAVVYRCIEYLEAKSASSEEGIFRLSGSQNVIKALRERFNNEGDVKLLDGNYYDVHAVASLLKLYLRELPSSVLTRDLHLDFLKCLEIEDKEQRIAALNVLVHMLPRANLELLSNLCSYLADIANASDVNKMNVRNVAIVFAPTLNIPAPLIQLFLTDYTAIFAADLDEKSQPHSSPVREVQMPPLQSDSIRSPRHQMFSDLPTPAYNQNTFPQQALAGFQPIAPAAQPPTSFPNLNRNTYAPQRTFTNDNSGGVNGFPAPPVYQATGPSEASFASLNALSTTAPGGLTVPSDGGNKKSRRESSMMGMNYGLVNQRQASRQTLRDTSSSRIPEDVGANGRMTPQSMYAQQRGRDITPERRY